ncbi:acyl-CoA thioesterase [Acidocella sp.]|uniref:acyl-CoA thioesterase n=1 Tax=Acidocella sp. TaxID=50710 RepID=UPI003D00E44F
MQNQPKLADFPFRSFDKLRYGDTDRQGHVNNAVFGTFLETGRCELLENGFGASWRQTGTSIVIARLELDFIAEILWPGQVEIGTAVSKIGNSSIRLVQVVFQEDRLVAKAQSVLVHLGPDKRPAPLPDAAREQLTGLMLACA